MHVYHKAGFRETGVIEDGEAVLMRMLKGPNRIIKNVYGVDVDQAMRIKGKRGYGVSIAVHDGDGGFLTYCAGSGRYGEDFPVNPDMLFQAGSVSKPMFALTLLRYVDKGLIDLDADISGVVPEFVKKGPISSWAARTSSQTEQWAPAVRPASVQVGSTAGSTTTV